MADLFLHLPFARRLRFADGLHPLAGEAIGRRPSLVILGATLASLPGREREGMSWLRRLFSGGGEAARWQKLLAPSPGQPHVDLIVSLLRAEDAAIGPMARFALGCGVLSHELLEEKLSGVTASLAGPQKAAIERAQARLWLQTIEGELKNGATLHGEWRPAADFGEAAGADAQKRTVLHVDRALKRVYDSGPGEGTLGRWLKALAAEVGPLAEGRGPLPPPLTMADADVRAAYFDQVGFVDKVRAAQAAFVVFANRLAEAFTKGQPDAAALSEALGEKLEEPSVDAAAVRARWTTWHATTREATMTRGRNPKPAFAEDGSGGHAASPGEGRLPSITKVMSLADLPPESDAAGTGAPPLPEQSGPLPKNMPPMPPTVTQEVSVAQIEAEARSFEAPPMTQEVSVAQIEAEAAASFQAGLAANVTQPISAAEVAAANEEDVRLRAAAGAGAGAAGAAGAAASPAEPPPAPMTDPPRSAEGPPAMAAPSTGTEMNGENGASHAAAPAATAAAAPGDANGAAGSPSPTLPTAQPRERPRE